MVRSRDSEAVPETRGAPVDGQRQILIRHCNRTVMNCREITKKTVQKFFFVICYIYYKTTVVKRY